MSQFFRNRIALGTLPQISYQNRYGTISSLLHMNGANASTTFTDETGKTWTTAGNAKLTSSAPKMGSACGTFDGTGDYISTPAHTDFYFATEDFTIDFWMKTSTTTPFLCAMGFGLSSASVLVPWFFRMNSTSTFFAFYYWSGATHTTLAISAAAASHNGTWHHVAIVRRGTSLKSYLDGVSSYNATLLEGFYFTNPGTVLSVGRLGADNSGYWNGQIDEVRILKGAGSWVGDFTPPTIEY